MHGTFNASKPGSKHGKKTPNFEFCMVYDVQAHRTSRKPVPAACQPPVPRRLNARCANFVRWQRRQLRPFLKFGHLTRETRDAADLPIVRIPETDSKLETFANPLLSLRKFGSEGPPSSDFVSDALCLGKVRAKEQT